MSICFFVLIWIIYMIDGLSVSSTPLAVLFFLSMSMQGHLESILECDATILRFNRQPQVNLILEILDLHLKSLPKTTNVYQDGAFDFPEKLAMGYKKREINSDSRQELNVSDEQFVHEPKNLEESKVVGQSGI